MHASLAALVTASHANNQMSVTHATQVLASQPLVPVVSAMLVIASSAELPTSVQPVLGLTLPTPKDNVFYVPLHARLATTTGNV